VKLQIFWFWQLSSILKNIFLKKEGSNTSYLENLLLMLIIVNYSGRLLIKNNFTTLFKPSFKCQNEVALLVQPSVLHGSSHILHVCINTINKCYYWNFKSHSQSYSVWINVESEPQSRIVTISLSGCPFKD